MRAASRQQEPLARGSATFGPIAGAAPPFTQRGSVLNYASIQRITEPRGHKNRKYCADLRPPHLRRADDGVDRPALPLPASSVRAACAAVHGDDRIGGDRARQGAAAARARSDEHPVALQLGGCDPHELAEAARIGAAAGFAEINLNVGCPSDRVKSGSFGACLMLKPALVAECVRAHARCDARCRSRSSAASASTIATTMSSFSGFVDAVAGAGAAALIVQRAPAILGGLTPKENREIPPLKYDYVHRLKLERPRLAIVLNGGVAESAAALESSGGGSRRRDARPRGLSPSGACWPSSNRRWSIPPGAFRSRGRSSNASCPMRVHRSGRACALHSITRHMHGLMAGRAGARAWRRFLSEVASRPDTPPEALFSALPLLNQGLAA